MPPPLTALQQKFAAKLSGGHFRVLNEQLYSQPGRASFAQMQASPALFDAYHAGYRAQVSGWPTNPLDSIIADVRSRPSGSVVADFGCGEARLSAAVGKHATVHSFDLVARAPGVIACDMSHVPLVDASVDTAIFCLSLMGTDYMNFLREATRVLRAGGRLLIAEIRSRFEAVSGGNGADAGGGKSSAQQAGLRATGKRPREGVDEAGGSVGGAGAAGGNGLDAFIRSIEKLGFVLNSRDEKNTMFVRLTFIKTKTNVKGPSGGAGDGGGGSEAPKLKACKYKKR